MLQTGVYTARIIARSVGVPSPADAITYTVGVNIGSGVVEFQDVSPQDSARWSSYMPTIGDPPKLIPFKIGRLVTLHVQVTGAQTQMFIGDAEIPEFDGCEVQP